MTLIEAARSGKKFKREKWNCWLIKGSQSEAFFFVGVWQGAGEGYEFSHTDVLATDWEVYHAPREWTVQADKGGIISIYGFFEGEVIKVREVIE